MTSPPAKTIDARILRSRDALLRAGLSLLNKNIDTPLTEIAARAGVGRATLYRQFETREQLIQAIAVECLKRMDEATAHIDSQANTALEAIRLLFASITPLSAELQFLMSQARSADDDPEVMAIHQQHHQEMWELVELAKAEGSVHRGLPTHWVVSVMDGLFYSAWLMTLEQSYSTEQIAELAFETFVNGVTRVSTGH